MKPLEGFRILEAYGTACPLALRIAGGLAGRVLVDLGATVVVGEPSKGTASPLHEAGDAVVAFLGAGKHLAPWPDALVLSAWLQGGNAAIVDEILHDALPHGALPAATAVLSLFGRDRPRGPGSELTATALSGVLDMVGDPSREPLSLGGHQAAYSVGLSASTGLLAALCDPDGATSPLWVNLVDTMAWINWKAVIGSRTQESPATRLGAAAEWQVISCRDGWIALVYQEQDWEALRRFVDSPLLDDARFATPADRLRHAGALAAVIEAALADTSRDQIRDAALLRRLPLGAVWSPAELLEDRQYRERELFAPTALPDGSTAPMICLPVRWNETRFRPGGPPGDQEEASWLER